MTVSLFAEISLPLCSVYS